MIFFLYGEDTYRSRQKLNLIKNRFLDKDKSGLNLVELDGAKILYKDLKKEFSASPFLCDKKLIIVENLLTQNRAPTTFEQLNAFIKSEKIPDFIFIIFREEGKPDSRKALFKTLKKTAESQEFDLLSGIQINKWIISEIRNRGGEIENKAVSQLAAFVGSDLWQMSNEIDKLVSYNKKITIENVNFLVSAKVDDNIFKIMDAISTRNKKVAICLINDQFRTCGKDLNYLMNMMVRQFRILIQIKSFVDSSKNFIPTPSQIGKELNLHPFVIQKTLPQAKNFEMGELKNIYSKLMDIDYNQKTRNADISVLLDLLIAGI